MLNYVWISLIAIGLFTAIGRDVNDEFANTYRNGVPFTAQFTVKKTPASIRPSYEGMVTASKESFDQFYGRTASESGLHQPVSVITLPNGQQKIIISSSDETPAVWKEMMKSAQTKDKLEGVVQSMTFNDDKSAATISFTLERISYVKIRAVTKAALEYADIAVTISLGLIGVMALWLGVMKVAEEAGLLKVLTRLLTPLTKRLFPEIPHDHPVIGSMIMNIAANMLGLNNAATPLGLKAMEELNKLNTKAGVASNTMVTFLVLNTGGLVLIPATAIAIRAAQGSTDPGIIIGTSIFGAGVATIAGLIASKIMERLPAYRITPDAPAEKKEVSND